MLRPIHIFSAIVLFSASISTPVKALPTELFLTENPIYQQTENSPCIIGDPSCNNPSIFDFTLIPPNTATLSLDSPTYTIALIRQIIGDFFDVGIDVQQSQNPLHIASFTMSIGGQIVYSYAGGDVPQVNHGNGYSDAVLRTFDISQYLGSDLAFFHVDLTGEQAARSQFFLGAAVPEPASAALLITGLIAGLASRKKFLY